MIHGRINTNIYNTKVSHRSCAARKNIVRHYYSNSALKVLLSRCATCGSFCFYYFDIIGTLLYLYVANAVTKTVLIIGFV